MAEIAKSKQQDETQNADADAIRKVRSLLCDPNFLALESDLRSSGFFSILGTTHKERWHSAFLAWLLNREGSHGLREFPLRRLLAVMASADVHEDKSEQARNHMPPLHELEAAEFRSCRVWPDAGSKDQRSEQTISPSGNKLDVLIAAEMTLPPRKGVAEKPIRLLFVIENKIKAAEEPDQTLSYAAWATDPARDKDLQ